jgi:hypothetical protein
MFGIRPQYVLPVVKEERLSPHLHRHPHPLCPQVEAAAASLAPFPASAHIAARI